MRYRLPWLLLLLIVPHPAQCYTAERVGINSNFLFTGEAVLFLQSDYTLTALALRDGQVLKRTPGQRFIGRQLTTIPARITVTSWSTFALLDQATFALLWQSDKAYGQNLVGDRLVSYDGNGLVSCRRLASGQVLWTFDLPGALDVVVEKGKVMVFRGSIYDSEKPQIIALLDLATGQELWRKSPPPGQCFTAAFFDGDTLYLPAGPAAPERSDTPFEHLVLWNTAGEETGSLPPPALPPNAFRPYSFGLNGKQFADGRVRPAPPPEEQTEPPPRSREYELDQGSLLVMEAVSGHVRLSYEGSYGRWRACLPYLERYHSVEQVAQRGDSILLGSDMGHVECLDARTGASRWVYVFPTMMHTMSYSVPAGMPPYVLDQARQYRHMNARKRQVTPTAPLATSAGLCAPPSATPAGHIIADPEPANPFRDLPLLLVMSWVPVVFSVLAVRGVLKEYRRGKATVRGLAAVGVLLLFLAGMVMATVGRASFSSALALKLTIVGLTVFVVWCLVGLVRKRRWIEAVLYAAILGGLDWLLWGAVLYA